MKLADAGGIESLSMRRLAQELGVEAMSLYNHVAGKADLVDGMLELVASEVQFPPAGPDWRTAMRESAISAHEVLMRHRWAAGLWMSVGTPSPVRLQQAEAILRAWREGGFSGDLTYHAFHTVQAYVLGFTLYLQSLQFDVTELGELATRFLREFPADDYPYLAEHIRQHAEPSAEREGTFAFGLELVLDGLERLRDADAASAPRSPRAASRGSQRSARGR